LNKKNRENTICEEEDEEIFFNENSNKSLIIGEYKKESDNTSEKNKIESHTNVESNNINRELNKMEPSVLKEIKKVKQRFNQSEIMTLNVEEEKKEEEEEKEEVEEKSEIKDQKKKNENQKKVEFLVQTKKNRGKERKNKRYGNSNIKIHSKNDYDNVFTSIQVHYINFIIKLANDILSSIYEQKKDLLFKDINYEFKKKINFNHFESLKSFSIKEILLNPISSKFKSENHDSYNREIYYKVIGSSNWLNEFFDMNYLSLFKNYYFNKNKRLSQINIKGKSFNLTENTKSFYDLYNKSDDERKKLLIKNIYRAYFGVQVTDEKNNMKKLIFKSSK
jgi:tRNA-binding EMAP/Myf-like protein